MSDEPKSKSDRREYWREYQRKRYEWSKMRRSYALGATPSEIADYKKAVEELGLKGQRHWRARKKLRTAMLAINKAEDIVEHIYKRARGSAASRDIEFTIEPAHVVLVAKCPILGVPLEYDGLGDKESVHKPSLDRIDNSKGYVPGNVQVVSARANVLKRDATLEELIQLGRWAKEQTRRK